MNTDTNKCSQELSPGSFTNWKQKSSKHHLTERKVILTVTGCDYVRDIIIRPPPSLHPPSLTHSCILWLRTNYTDVLLHRILCHVHLNLIKTTSPVINDSHFTTFWDPLFLKSILYYIMYYILYILLLTLYYLPLSTRHNCLFLFNSM